MKRWTSNLRRVLRLALRDDARDFVVSEKQRDGVLVVRPTQDVWGIGGRLAERGILPADAAPEAFEMLVEIERRDDPVWECRYIHVRARAGRQFAPMDAKLALGWPLRSTDILLTVLRRGLRELIEGARVERALAERRDRGLVDGLRRQP